MWIDPDSYHYIPILILMAVGLGIGVILVGANHFLGTRARIRTKEKYEVYECGVPATGNARQQFSVRYYVVGIIFLLFDVEVVFMYPWAVVYRKFLAQGYFILFEMLTFFVILLAGYFYLLGRRGLDWD